MRRLIAFSLAGVLLTACSHFEQAQKAALVAANNSGICSAHHVQMTKETLPVIYGFIVVSPEERATEEELGSSFPFARWGIFGGCDLSEIVHVEGWVCPRCEKERSIWMKVHPDDPWVKAHRQAEPNQPPKPTR